MTQKLSPKPPYRKHPLTLSLLTANLLSLLMILPVAFLAWPYIELWSWERLAASWGSLNLGKLAAVFIIGVIAHELLHGLGWMIFGKIPVTMINYGFHLKTLTPYAHCTKPLPVRAYRWGVIMPGLVLGIVPCIIGIVSGNASIMLFGQFFTLAAGGDVLILWLLRHIKPGQMVEDHPSAVGCYVIDGD